MFYSQALEESITCKYITNVCWRNKQIRKGGRKEKNKTKKIKDGKEEKRKRRRKRGRKGGKKDRYVLKKNSCFGHSIKDKLELDVQMECFGNLKQIYRHRALGEKCTWWNSPLLRLEEHQSLTFLVVIWATFMLV